MIISVSRRTDIPKYFTEWFLNRLKEGFVYVRNPYNYNQVKRVDLSKDNVDCFVFWSKDPKKLLEKIEALNGYHYYFQFTITGYDNDIEPSINKKEVINTFKELASKIGKEKVIWRYDPILLNDKYTIDYHIKAFTKLADILKDYTCKVIISFIDIYPEVIRNINLKQLTTDEVMYLSKFLAQAAHQNGLLIQTCSESYDLNLLGIEKGACIDKKLIESITNKTLLIKKDKNQRENCNCITSIDIGAYNTCIGGCKYCYANSFPVKTIKNNEKYDVNSLILCDFLDI